MSSFYHCLSDLTFTFSPVESEPLSVVGLPSCVGCGQGRAGQDSNALAFVWFIFDASNV